MPNTEVTSLIALAQSFDTQLHLPRALYSLLSQNLGIPGIAKKNPRWHWAQPLPRCTTGAMIGDKQKLNLALNKTDLETSSLEADADRLSRITLYHTHLAASNIKAVSTTATHTDPKRVGRARSRAKGEADGPTGVRRRPGTSNDTRRPRRTVCRCCGGDIYFGRVRRTISLVVDNR